jgi:hypothetical protein
MQNHKQRKNMNKEPVARIPAASIQTLDQVTKSIELSRKEVVTPSISIRFLAIRDTQDDGLGKIRIISSGAFTILQIEAVSALDSVSLKLELETLADYHSWTSRHKGEEVQLVRTLANPVSPEELAAQTLLALSALGNKTIVGEEK